MDALEQARSKEAGTYTEEESGLFTFTPLPLQ